MLPEDTLLATPRPFHWACDARSPKVYKLSDRAALGEFILDMGLLKAGISQTGSWTSIASHSLYDSCLRTTCKSRGHSFKPGGMPEAASLEVPSLDFAISSGPWSVNLKFCTVRLFSQTT